MENGKKNEDEDEDEIEWEWEKGEDENSKKRFGWVMIRLKSGKRRAHANLGRII